MRHRIGTQAWKKAALRLDLFAGDKEPAYDRLLRDEIVIAAREHTCPECQQKIIRGQFCRVLVAVDAGEIVTFRLCQKCLSALLLWQSGDCEPYYNRLEMGRRVINEGR